MRLPALASQALTLGDIRSTINGYVATKAGVVVAEVIIPNGFGMATMRWSHTGRTNPFSVTCGFKQELELATPQEIADEWYDAWIQTGGPCASGNMRDTFVFLGVDVFIQTDDGPTGGSSSGPPQPGTITIGEELKVNTTMLVQKRTAFVGREQRGRMYVPALKLSSSTMTSLGTITSDAVAEIQGQFNLVFDQLSEGPAPMYLLHSKIGNTPDAITSLTMRSQGATQRRRFN